MTNSLWKWLDRHLDPVAVTRLADSRRDDSAEEWARRQWVDFEHGFRWRLRHHPDLASCPACYEMQAVEDARYLAEAHPEPAERIRYGTVFTDSQVALTALGDCRCGYWLTAEAAAEAAAEHAADELRHYLEEASE